MNRIYAQLRLFSAIACAGALALWPQLADAGAAGRFQFVNGDVVIIDSGGLERRAKKGAEISEGETLVTGSDASAQLRMVDEGIIAVRPNSRMKIDAFQYAGKEDGTEKSFISLMKGGFRAITGAIGKVNKQNYQIKTPAATIGIRGTDHEPVHIPIPLAGEIALGKPGTYDKVNLGQAVLQTPQGILVLGMNQVGYVADMNSKPMVLPQVPEFYRPAPPPAERKKAEEKREEEKARAEGDKEKANAEDKARAEGEKAKPEGDKGKAEDESGRKPERTADAAEARRAEGKKPEGDAGGKPEAAERREAAGPTDKTERRPDEAGPRMAMGQPRGREDKAPTAGGMPPAGEGKMPPPAMGGMPPATAFGMPGKEGFGKFGEMTHERGEMGGRMPPPGTFNMGGGFLMAGAYGLPGEMSLMQEMFNVLPPADQLLIFNILSGKYDLTNPTISNSTQAPLGYAGFGADIYANSAGGGGSGGILVDGPGKFIFLGPDNMPVGFAESTSTNSFQYDAGTATLHGSGSASVGNATVRWGRYEGGGTVIDNSSVREPLAMHFVTSSNYMPADAAFQPAPVVTATYDTLVGATVSNSLGQVGTVTSVSIVANFSTSTVSNYVLGLNIPSVINGTVSGNGSFASFYGSSGISLSDGSYVTGHAHGAFVGNYNSTTAPSGVISSFDVKNSSTGISGAGAFAATPAP